MKNLCHFTICCLAIGAIVGCGSAVEEPAAPQPQSMQVRAQRRAFMGAPPIIPHPPLSGTCINCHTPVGGKVVPEIGLAPANPHTHTFGMSKSSRCKQCHVFKQDNNLFVESEFVAISPARHATKRAHATTPPVVPHGHFMRENCNACHSGAAARPEITCRHSDRLRCQQCHINQEGPTETEVLMDEQFVTFGH